MEPTELHRARREGVDLVVLDVREPFELELAALPGVVHVPLRELPARLGALDPRRRTVVLCHHGVRSAAAAAFLRAQGFTDVHNLEGGIDAWSADVDPGVPRY